MPSDQVPLLTVKCGEIVAFFRGRQQRLPLSEIVEIVAYKWDEITTDLICIDAIISDGTVWTFHEEMAGFDDLIASFERLPGFAGGWRDKVILPAFARNRTVVWVKPG